MENLTDVSHFVHPDTVIYTKRGPKPIRSVTTTDFVVTKSGDMLPVTDVYKKNYVGNLYSIDGHQMHEDHEILIAHPGMSYPHFVEAKHMTTDLEVVSVLPSLNIDVPLTTQDLTMYGLLLSAGDLVDDGDESPKITMNETIMNGFVRDYCEKNDLHLMKDTESRRVMFDLPFNKEMLFDNRDKKMFYSPLALLSAEKIAAVRSGIWLGGEGNEDASSITVESKALAESLRFLFLRCHIPIEVDDNKLTKVSSDLIRWLDDNTMAKPIKHIDTVHFDGTLFDLKIAAGNDDGSSYLSTLAVNHNGGGKRNGSFAIYLEPWHGDIFEFLELKKPHGEEEKRARDLFYALWIPDLFMERVESDATWSLMDPNVSRGLADVYGDDFKTLYEKYESEGKFMRQIPARELWNHILVSQIETGTPYMLYKDAINKKSNQSNLGTIKSSNLCTEITEFTSPEECAVCNLASISLPAFVDREDVSFMHEKLHDVIKVITRNLNKVIDINFYPIQEAETSNMRHRPIGIGIQGLADVFCMLKYPFESQDAKKLSREIAETMYHGALEASCEIAAEREADILEYKQLASIEEKTKEIKKQINSVLKRTKFSQEELTRPACPGAYDSYFWNGGCPVSKGILQFDMWGVTPSDRWDWVKLKESIESHGIRNSLLIAPMPTASTSQILGNMESFEPFTSNIYTRRTIAGEFVIVNKHLLRDLIEMGLWNDDMKQQILAHEGSIQNIEIIPKPLREVYKTVWEIKQRSVIDMAADRGAYTCQSQSLNLYCPMPTTKVLTSMHHYGWSKGNKTGSYYIRCLTRAKTQQFTVDPKFNRPLTTLRGSIDHPKSENANMPGPTADEVRACSLANRENCDACGS